MKKLMTLILMSLVCGAVWGQTNKKEIAFQISNTPDTYYKKIGFLDSGNGQIRICGILGAHKPSQGKSTLDITLSARDQLIAQGQIDGSSPNSYIILVQNGTGAFGPHYDVYIRYKLYAQVNLEIISTGFCLVYDEQASTSTPGTVAWSSQDYIGSLTTSSFVADIKASGTVYASAMKVSNNNSSSDSESIIKAAYSYDGTARTRSARLELGTHDVKGQTYYGKVWAIESITGSTWANSPEFRINQGTKSRLRMNYLGNIGIGKAPSSEIKLDVEGAIRATEIRVETNGNTADFVFEDNYQLKDLSEVEAFIKANKHLPEIPSAAAMEEAGVNLAKMNKLLLMKVEELTLYSIELEKEVKKESEERRAMRSENEKKVSGLEFRVQEQEERLAKIEALLKELSK